MDSKLTWEQHIARVALITWRNVGNSSTRATIELLSNDMVRVAIRVARPWKVLPGQHLYLYMPSVGLWESHPFSIAWADTNTLSYEKAKVVYLLVKAENGFTKKLVERAARSRDRMFSTVALVEGAYGKLANRCIESCLWICSLLTRSYLLQVVWNPLHHSTVLSSLLAALA